MHLYRRRGPHVGPRGPLTCCRLLWAGVSKADYSEAFGGSQAEYEAEKDFERVLIGANSQPHAGTRGGETLLLVDCYMPPPPALA